MKISDSSIKFMFYATWAMMTFRSILEGIPSVTLNLKFLTLVSMLFVLIILSHQKYTIIEFFKIMFICFVGLIISIKTETFMILWSVLILIISKNIDVKVCYRITLVITSVIFLTVVLGSMTGLIKNHTIQSDFFDASRYCMGFDHPNTCQSTFFLMCIMIIYSFWDKFNIIWGIVLIWLQLLLFGYIKSRTGLIIVFITVFLAVAFKSKFRKFFSQLCIYFLPICLIVLLVLLFLYPQLGISHVVDKLITGRVSQAYQYLVQYGIHLFGNNIIELSSDYVGWHNMLDCGHYRLLINYGLIIFAFYEISIIGLMIKFYREEKLDLMIVLIAFFFYGITESFISYIFSNVSILLFSLTFFKETRRNDIERAGIL